MATRIFQARTMPRAAPNQAPDYQEFVQGIHDTLAAFGWVQTSDTGQMASGSGSIAAATFPATRVTTDYEIWRMADSQQATTPVFMRIEYGQGFSGSFALRITLGPSTNGAGVVASPKSTPSEISLQATSTNRWDMRCSGDAGRFTMSVAGEQTTDLNSYGIINVERLRKADGTYNTDGAHVCWWTSPTGQGQGTMPLSGSDLAQTTSGTWPVITNRRGSMGGPGLDIGVSPVQPNDLGRVRNPVMGPLIYAKNDIVAGTIFSVDFLGGSHTYRATGITNSALSQAVADSNYNPTVAILWE